MSFVQSWSSSAIGPDYSASVEIIGATPGNLLVATLTVKTGSDGLVFDAVPDGWVLISDSTGAFTWIYNLLMYRIADGSEGVVPITWSVVPSTWTKPFIVSEYSAVDSLDDNDFNYEFYAPLPINCGSVTPSNSTGVSVAIVGADDSRYLPNDTIEIDGGFVIDAYESVGSQEPVSAMASLSYTDTAPQSPWWTSHNTTTTRGYVAAIAVFAPGGGVVVKSNSLFFGQE